MKEDFLRLIALAGARGASFQHAGVYASNVSEKQKESFVSAFNENLVRLEEMYKHPISDKKHIEVILTFANDLSRNFPAVLRGKKMRIGVAQKAVNLYLKYLWCFGWIPTPPHCPIDSNVIKEVKLGDAWTKISSVDEYVKIIDRVKQKTGKQSLSEWECELWNKINRQNA